jgi:hypothetical protein
MVIITTLATPPLLKVVMGRGEDRVVSTLRQSNPCN